jgi:DNA repair protein RAD7
LLLSAKLRLVELIVYQTIRIDRLSRRKWYLLTLIHARRFPNRQLQAHRISAREIRENYEERRRQAEATANNGVEVEDEDGDVDAAEAAIERSRRRQQQEEAVEKIKSNKAKMAKAKAQANAKKTKGKTKKKKKKGNDDSDDSEDGDYDDALARDLYAKSKPLPGQFENCEVCSKRFTVTPYSKTGPDGGLICTPCGKKLDNGNPKQPATKKESRASKSRRKMESDKMDGVSRKGPRSLVEQAMETVVRHYDSVESLDEVPEHLVEGIRRLFTKKRVLDSKTFPLFLRADLTELVIYDCAGRLSTEYR